MTLVVLTILVVFAVTFSRGYETCCIGIVNECFNDDPPFDHLPLPYCEDDIEPYTKLWTREGGNEKIDVINIPIIFSPFRRTVVLAHGFLQEGDTYWMEDIRKALLEKEDLNIIQVGWEEGAQTINYFQAASDIRVVGAYLAKVLKNLVVNHGAEREDIWCMGHSLGSHLCGHAGMRFKIGRISGLDPAGPLFERYDIMSGLNPTAADYVDVIHTMGGDGIIMNFGTLKPLGHADFYPNNGKVQPGCINYLSERVNPIFTDISPVCSHFRAIDYMEESVKGSCEFWVRRKCDNEKNLPGSCEFCFDCAIMGYQSDTLIPPGRFNIFYLRTNDDSPFCQG